MIAREQGGNRIYFLYDLLSARATITDGAGGSIQGRQAHLPFGEELNSTGTNDKHRFTSYERDSETGSDYAINRGYSQVLGRFLQADPYRASGSAEDPQSWNRYRYSRNDPVNLVDPNGLLEWNPYACGAGYHWDFWAARCVPNGTAHNPGLPWSDLNLGTLWGSLPLMLPPLSPGLGLKDYWATELINALKGLSQECKNFLGTDAAINQRIAEINSGALPIRVVTETSKDQIPNSPRGETFSQYWNRLPEATRINSVAYTVNYGGQAQPYNSIIVGPMFYSGSPDLLPFVNNKIGDFRALTLVHEFMHVLNNMGDVALFNKWKEEGATLDDSLHPSIALFKWLADNCPNTK
jgi:RHS repeat-associated protein